LSSWGISFSGRVNINHNRDGCATFLNRLPSHPARQQPYKFSEFSVLSVDKKKILIADQWKKSTVFLG
jgi:hypothetical protein